MIRRHCKQYITCIVFLALLALIVNFLSIQSVVDFQDNYKAYEVLNEPPINNSDASFYIVGKIRPRDEDNADDTTPKDGIYYGKAGCIPWLWPATLWPGYRYKGLSLCRVRETDRYRVQVEFAAQLSRQQRTRPREIKTVYIYNKILKDYDKVLLEEAQKQCPNIPCKFTVSNESYETADAVFRVAVWNRAQKIYQVPLPKNSWGNQTLILLTQESALKSKLVDANSSHFKLLATVRRDSDLYTPFWFYHYYNDSVKHLPQRKNYAAGKTKLAVMIVSNCNAYNNRLRYTVELMKYIPVDVYGFCGFLKLDLQPFHKWQFKLEQYKFYLAFENSNCRDYITEKFFHGLLSGVVPVTLGAHPKDYSAIAPQDSYISVEDFKSPKALADYLKYLDKNDHAYNYYFRWVGTGRFEKWKEQFLCRACAMLHYQDLVPRPSNMTSYKDADEWWLRYNSKSPCLPPFKWYWNRDYNESRLPGIWFTNGTSLFGGYKIV